MLDIKTIREREGEVRDALATRGIGADIDAILEADKNRRGLLSEVEALKSRRNKVSKEIGALVKKGEDASSSRADMRALGDQIKELDEQIRQVELSLAELLMLVPNIPHSSVPPGLDAGSNVVVREVGEKREFQFKPSDHVEIGERLGILDFARATRMTGAGFPLYLGLGARLERALIGFMLDLHTREHGYTEMSPPFLCNEKSMTGTGQLPKLADDMYRTQDGFYLIPTAEVPVTNYFREEIIEQPLPVCFTAYTPCFRREAGAAGKETRGLLRVHQFDKVEMVKFVEPESSYDELERLLQNAEAVLQKLGLSYRVLLLCAGDMSFAAAKCYDIEVWAPGRNAWLEVSSCSNFEAFQARRASIRYRPSGGKPDFVHTLNGSGVALARLVVAILENYQQADGSVELPPAIVPYMDNISKLTPPPAEGVSSSPSGT
ncbi:MAG: serine--tRNA ligase [Lentisphaerales bacterium]|jgi:seryl-tRNA synthetase|nr:MAG: serine--tRNA ligase [Lentisphaerales bacterium]